MPTIKNLAQQIADSLGETEDTPQRKIELIVNHCGEPFAEEVLAETIHIEEQGGMMVKDGSRRRTPGGVFFFLVKERLRNERRYEDLDVIFPRVSLPPHRHITVHTPPSRRTPPPIVPRIRPRPKVATPSREAAEYNGERGERDGSAASSTVINRYNQEAILRIIQKHIGNPPDLYKRSVNTATGEVTMHFHFPSIARQHYQPSVDAASDEAGVSITISPHPHQQALRDTATALLPNVLTPIRSPSLIFEHQTIRMVCSGEADAEHIEHAQQRFRDTTGWQLDIKVSGETGAPVTDTVQGGVNQHEALTIVRQALGQDCYKVSAHSDTQTLTVRFFFPDTATAQHAQTLADLQTATGWRIVAHDQPHQGKLAELARQFLPPHITLVGDPSLRMQYKTVVVSCEGEVEPSAIEQAQTQFQTTTGWTLEVQHYDAEQGPTLEAG